MKKMIIYKYLAVMTLGLLVASCGSDSEDAASEISLQLEGNKKEYKLGETIKANIGTTAADSVIYFLGPQRLEKTMGGEGLDYTFGQERLGKWNLIAKVYRGGNLQEAAEEITLFNDNPPVSYTYEILNTYPHAPDAYTQGLEFYNNELYESTGQYGESSLRKVDLQTGEVLRSVEIPSEYFAEGLSILNDKIYLLTWKEGVGFVYDVESFEKAGEFAYNQSEQGWGLTNDGEKFYKSDGTEKIWFLNAETLAEEGYIQTVTHRTISTQLNELEWVEGKIYANTYQKDGVAIINPENGAIEGIINFSGLRDQLGNTDDLDPINDVLNGIAYNPDTGKLYVTGKDWDTLFEVQIKEN